METTGTGQGRDFAWQRRRGGVRVYFCCCPIGLLAVPPLVAARLARLAATRLAAGRAGRGRRTRGAG